MKTNYVLIDYENVQVKSLALLKGEHFQVRVFLGPRNAKLATEFVLAMKELGNRGDYIVMDTNGANALDFHLAYYLGRLSAADPTAFYHIISKDTGFDPLVEHLKKLKIQCVRSVSIDEMPCFVSAAAVKEVKPAPAVKVPAAKITKPTTAVKKKADEWIEVIILNLGKLGTSKPRTTKSLTGKIKNWCGKAYSDKEIEAIYNRLVKKRLVSIDADKVSYNLPE